MLLKKWGSDFPSGCPRRSSESTCVTLRIIGLTVCFLDQMQFAKFAPSECAAAGKQERGPTAESLQAGNAVGQHRFAAVRWRHVRCPRAGVDFEPGSLDEACCARRIGHIAYRRETDTAVTSEEDGRRRGESTHNRESLIDSGSCRWTWRKPLRSPSGTIGVATCVPGCLALRRRFSSVRFCER